MKVNKLAKNLKYHIVDTTALLISTNPIYTAMEVGIAGMTDKLSIDSRITVAAISYLGMGFAFARGRDFSRKKFGITKESKEKTKVYHDMGYTAAFNLVMAPSIYLAMGSDVKQAVVGGFSAAGLSLVMGPIMGYAVDAMRDLAGLEECERTSFPDFIKKQTKGIKKSLIGACTAASIGLMAGIYALTPEPEEIADTNKIGIEEIVENNSVNDLYEK